MTSELKKLIKNTSISAIQKYFESEYQELVADLDWSLEQKLLKKQILERFENIPADSLAPLESMSERVNSLTDELGQNVLQNLLKSGEHAEYSKLENEFDRSFWLYCKDDGRFAQAEDHWYADTRRQGQMWEGFLGPKDIAVNKDSEVITIFKEKLKELYKTAGKIQILIYDRIRLDNEENDTEIIQVMVYREDLPVSFLEFEIENENVITKTVKPVKEVALTYEPKSGVIEIIAEGVEQRKFITKAFSEILLKSPIPGEKIPVKQYNIQGLLKNVVLSFDPEDGIESVKVTMLKVARPNSGNSVTLDVAAKESVSIYDVSKEYFSENDPLKSGFVLKQVRISIKFFPDDESRRGKILHVKIGEPNICDLKSKTHKEKLIGEKYLKQWNLVKTL